MSTSLVTGGSGYFGSLLVERLVARGDAVRVLDISDASDRPAGVQFVLGDIRDSVAVADAVAGCDVVYHNVAQVPLAKDPELLRTVNVDGTRLLLDAAKQAGVGKVVHTSSSAVFGVPDSNPVLPTTVPKPQEAYGQAKLAAEWACLDACRAGLDVSIVRPRTILGHGRLGIFGILFDWIADGADPIVLGTGGNRYQFVHAEDLADACIAAAGVAGPGVFNIGTDRFGTMFEALDHLCCVRRHRRHRAQPPRQADRARDACQRRIAHHPVRPLSLVDVLEVDVVRHRARPPATRVATGVVDRRHVPPELRLVRRPPRTDIAGRERAPPQRAHRARWRC